MSVKSQHSSFRPWWLVAEMLMVFVGVYGAFYLEGCREDRVLQERRTQILNLLDEDFTAAAEDLRKNEAGFDQAFGRFLKEYENGGQPPLYPIPVPAFQPVDTWGPLLASGGIETLDVGLIRAVEAVLGAVSEMSAVAGEYNEYVRHVLIPGLDKEGEEFYLESGSLRGKYLWYYYSLQGLQKQFAGLIAATEAAAEKVRESAAR